VKAAWALMPRRASIAIATAALLGVALAGQAIAGDGTVGQKVTIARGKFAHHSWSLGVQGRHRQRCYVLSLSAAGSASAGGTCRSDVRRPPLWERVLGVSDDNATAELNVTRTRVRRMKLRIGHPHSNRPSEWVHVRAKRITRHQADQARVRRSFRFGVPRSRGEACVNKVALFDSDGRRIYKKRVPCEF
jgi:hypothetical protein